MELVQPIRQTEIIEQMKCEFMKDSYRDYMLFFFGINTGLRISDILSLKVSDVNGTHITIKEQKTDKVKRFKISPNLQLELSKYVSGMSNDDYLFKSQKGNNKPITRIQAYRVLNKTADKIGVGGEIGTHTLRKTFGYHFYQKTKDVALLQNLFNHSSPSVTLRYIGINQDMLDDAMDNFSL